MNGGRQLFTCPTCGKCFFYWVPETTPQPKVKCYFCNAEAFPNGEPPAAPAPAPSPAAPVPPAAAPPAEGTPPPAS
jgi:hypothetical protein